MDQEPPPPEPDSAPADRAAGSDPQGRLTWRIAVLSAAAALLGSLIGTGGAAWISEKSLDHAEQQRTVELRREAYQDFLAAVEDVLSEVDASRNGRRTDPDGKSPPRTPESLIAGTKAIINLQFRMNEPATRVSIYGSRAGARSALVLQGEVNELLASATIEAIPTELPPNLPPYAEQRPVVTSAQKDMTEIVRDELGGH